MGMRNTDKYMTFDTLIDSPEMRWNTKKPFILKLSLHVHMKAMAMASGRGEMSANLRIAIHTNTSLRSNSNTIQYKNFSFKSNIFDHL